jgi:ADP-ribose pyrophosphatase
MRRLSHLNAWQNFSGNGMLLAYLLSTMMGRSILKSDPLNPPWCPSYGIRDMRIDGRDKRYQGFCQIEQVKVAHRLFDQDAFSPVLTRELLIRRPAVGVMIHDPIRRELLLIEQWRVGAIDDPVSAWQLEVVAGLIDDGETPEQAAIREAYEETGVMIDQLQLLHRFYPSAGACNEFFHLYTATADLSHAGGIHGALDEGENIRVHVLAYDAINTLLSSGRLVNAPVIIALQWLNIQHSTPVIG